MIRKMTGIAAAAALALAPTMATAQQSIGGDAGEVRASANLSGANYLAGGSTPVLLGVILIVLFGVVAISDNGDDPDNTPVSP